MSLLDRCPFDPADPEAQTLLGALGHLYPLATQAQRPIFRAGIRLQDIALNDAMTDVWPRVLHAAANQGRLRALVAGIAADPNRDGHEIFARLAQTRARRARDRRCRCVTTGRFAEPADSIVCSVNAIHDGVKILRTADVDFSSPRPVDPDRLRSDHDPSSPMGRSYCHQPV
ncbi:effector-associated domain EAD1-containing protein [Nocardia fluminea]|uniref:effector-associated domain EAD1-containing protein n=1 Tax=Nocardia fluminea TaxID=134984 RepID=UPI0037B7DDDB